MKENLIPKRVRDIEAYTPNLNPVKVRLDANESPFLPSKKLLDALSAAVYEIDYNRYPDPFAVSLCEKFAALYGISADNVTAGNGSDELISLIAGSFTEAGDRVLVAVPDFSMYTFYANLAGAANLKIMKNEDFSIDFDKLTREAESSQARIVIFSNPCNPTGWVMKRDEVIDFIEKTDAIVVVDEAYMEFSQDDESVIDLVTKYDNLIVLKTLSKAFGAAALRIGFMVAGGELTKAVRKVKSPYNVNSVSQRFGEIILDNVDEIRAKTAEIKENLTCLQEELSKLCGDKILQIHKTAANFVYIKTAGEAMSLEIYSRLMEEGVAIRRMGEYLRVCAGTRAECEIFLKKFKEAIA